MPTIYTPSTVLAIAAAFLALGFIFGWGICALLMTGSRSDDESDFHAKLMALRTPHLWRYRPVASGRWIYTEDHSELSMVPHHWQCQSFSFIANMVDLDAPYTGDPSTKKEQEA